MSNLYLVAAVARDLAIGQAGCMPWGHLSHDLQAFRLLTTARNPLETFERLCRDEEEPYDIAAPMNALIMGRKTWEGVSFSHLNRQVYVATRNVEKACCAKPGAFGYGLLDGMLLMAQALTMHRFLVGGSAVYSVGLTHPECTGLFLTEIRHRFPQADTHFPATTVDWSRGTLHAVASAERRVFVWRRMLASDWRMAKGVAYRFTRWERS